MSEDALKFLPKRDKIMSCAECRRLKSKCDRVFPCSLCRKRGLAELCPNGTLPTRQRKQTIDRSQSADASISDMKDRIRELEATLRLLQPPHHLLALVPPPTQNLQNSRIPTVDGPGRSDSSDEDREELDVSLGTLSLDNSGKSSFLGQTAGMESLYQNDLTDELHAASFQDSFDPIKDHVLHPLISNISSDDIMRQLEAQIPDPARAWALCDSYYNHAAWMYSFIPRPQFEEEILLPVYTPVLPALTINYTDVASMFTIFAIGSLLEINPPVEGSPPSSRPPAADEDYINVASQADYFYQLARAAMSAGPAITEEPTVSGVRSVFLMAFYHMVLDRRRTPQNVWSLASMGVGLAISIGLHRDSGPWKLDAALVEQRRALFWELYFFISMVVRLTLGRPPLITLQFVDCKLGPEPEQWAMGAGLELGDTSRYRMRFVASTILSEVRDVVLSTREVKYREVLLLDRKLRDSSPRVYGGEVGARNVGPDELRGPTRAATMQRFYWLGQKDSLVMYIHRKYFVRACMLSSEELPKSRYCPSLLAAFRSAQVIISLMGALQVVEPDLPRKYWFCWTHTLASAIIVASIVIRHPSSVLAEDAMRDLQTVLEQLQQWSQNGRPGDRPNKALRFVTRLHERARWALALPDVAVRSSPTHSPELSVLGGHARVFPAVRPPVPSGPSSGSGSENVTPTYDLHPALMEDVNSMTQRHGVHVADSPHSSMSPKSTIYNATSQVGQEQAFTPSMFGETNFSAVSAEETPMPDIALEHLGDMFSDETAGYAENYSGTDLSWQSFVAGLGLSESVYA